MGLLRSRVLVTQHSQPGERGDDMGVVNINRDMLMNGAICGGEMGGRGKRGWREVVGMVCIEGVFVGVVVPDEKMV